MASYQAMILSNSPERPVERSLFLSSDTGNWTMVVCLLFIAGSIATGISSSQELFAQDQLRSISHGKAAMALLASPILLGVGLLFGYSTSKGLPRVYVSSAGVTVEALLGTRSIAWTDLGQFEPVKGGQGIAAPIRAASGADASPMKLVIPAMGKDPALLSRTLNLLRPIG